jgi:hypothetical protein
MQAHALLMPRAYAEPGTPNSIQAEQSVALSDKAATHPGKSRPAMAKSAPDFTFLPIYTPSPISKTKYETNTTI